MTLQTLQRSLAGLFLLAFALIVPLQAQEPAVAPEGIPPESDYMYRKHYEQVQQIMRAPLGEREARLDSFMKAVHPKSKILGVLEGFFGQVAKDYQAAGQADKASALMAKMQKLFPESSASQAQAFQQAYQAKDHAKVIQLGAPMYAQSPNPQMAVALAQSYIATNNGAKAAEFSEKAVAGVGAKDGVYFAAWLANYYRGQGNTAKSLEYYNQILAAFPSGTPQGWDAKGWNELKATAYTVRASDAYVKKDYPGAISSYQESLKYMPGNDAAYLFIGLGHWRQQQLDEAMDAFAKAVVLNGSNAAKAREYLEQIYKPRHDDSLEGLDELLAKAKADLGTG